ncbi:MAG: aminotransferase class IV, partial [Candidatus Ornithospirochaeta sp.]
MNDRHAIRNGEIIKESNAVVNVTLSPVQSNFSVYEALRVLKRHVVHLDDHIKRLEKSAESIHLNLPEVDWENEINKLIEEDNISDATMRILVVGTEEPL